MVRPQEIENSTERLNEYLGSFKLPGASTASANTAGEAAIDEYLLERTAQELRAAQERRDTLKREVSQD